MKHFTLIPVLLFILFSCQNNPKTSASDPVTHNKTPSFPIHDFIKKFRILQPPVYYLGWMENERYLKQSFVLQKNSIDTLFHSLSDDLPVYGYGMLADTSAFYSLIYFETAEDHYPVLVTYSKSGQQLCEQALVVRGCGSDCGLKYCSYTAHIDKNASIYIADTVRYEGSCDSAGNYTAGDSTFIFSKTGHIDKKGTIKMSEEKAQRTGKLN